jgi:hypothetical protein
MPNDQPTPAYDRAVEAYEAHRTHALDLNQPAELREYHRQQSKRAEGDILELFDTQGD